MRRVLALSGLVALYGLMVPEPAAAQFTIDDFPPSVVPGRSHGTLPGWSGFGYGGHGAKGQGYWTGLAIPPDDYGHGPSGAYSPIFSSLIAAPKDNLIDRKRYDLQGAPHAGPPPGATVQVMPGPSPTPPPQVHHHADSPHRSLRDRLRFWRK